MTRDELRRALQLLGLSGEAIVVHAQLDKLGLEEPAAASVFCESLMEAVGTGTILMPAFTPATIVRTASRDQPRSILESVPFSPDLATEEPVAEAMRHLPGVLRSQHPTHSFLAVGPLARELLSTHRDNNPLGPLKKLNLYRGSVVLAGAGLEQAVALHIALEGKLPAEVSRRIALRINAGAHVERVIVENFPGCSKGFDKLEAFIRLDKIQLVPLPRASLRKVPLRYLLQLAHSVLDQDPAALFCDDAACKECSRAKAHVAHASLHPK